MNRDFLKNLGLADEEGMSIFTLKDKVALRKKNRKVIKRIFEEIVRLSGSDVKEGQKKLNRNRERRFDLRLALALGYVNVDKMLEEITTGQFREWIAFYSLEPWGIGTLDCLFAHFKALFCNSSLPKGKRPFKSERFMLYADKKQDASALYDVESGEEPEDEDDTDHNRPGEDF